MPLKEKRLPDPSCHTASTVFVYFPSSPHQGWAVFVFKWLCFATSPVSCEQCSHQRIWSSKTALRNFLGKLAYHSVEIRQHIVQHSLRYSDAHFPGSPVGAFKSEQCRVQTAAVLGSWWARCCHQPLKCKSVTLAHLEEKKSAIQIKCNFSWESRAGTWRRSRIWLQSSTRRFAEGK